MAETADMLTEDDQIVYLPDMRAGCSMVDMANIYQTEESMVRAYKNIWRYNHPLNLCEFNCRY